MFKGKSEKSSQFESWRETVLLIFSELCELVSNQRLFTLDSIIERNNLTGKSHRDEFKKEKKKKRNAVQQTEQTMWMWHGFPEHRHNVAGMNRTKRGSFPGLCMGGFLFPFASSAFTSLILCLAEMHCCVACVASCCGPSRVAPEARPESVRKGCCVIGLAFERHVA